MSKPRAARKGVREPRWNDSREANSRDAKAKFLQTLNRPHNFFIHPSLVGKDKEMFWGRYEINSRGTPDKSRIPVLLSREWRPVAQERAATFGLQDYGQDVTSNNIERDGLVLLERDKKFGEWEREFLNKKTEESVNQLPGTENFRRPGYHAKALHETSFERAREYYRDESGVAEAEVPMW